MSDSLTPSMKKNKSFPGTIAIITSDPSIDMNNYSTAIRMAEKYGKEKVIHVTWPADFVAEKEKITKTLDPLTGDKEIKILVVSQAINGSNAAVDRFKKLRDDVFIVYSTIMEPYAESALRANLLIVLNHPEMASAMVKQAKKQGAKAFVHYSFPRHMNLPVLFTRRLLIKAACASEGILFVDAEVPDPRGEAGSQFASETIVASVHNYAAKYGENTAFFCTNCFLQAPLIKAIVENHAIYPQGCCPSPYRGFPEALGIETGKNLADLPRMIGEVSRIAAEKNMTDRLSSWPVSATRIATNAAVEYALKWVNKEISRDGINDKVLEECIKHYVEEVVGEGVEVAMSSYSENGVTYDNFKMLLMSYLDF